MAAQSSSLGERWTTPKEEIKQIKTEALGQLIVVGEPAASGGGKNRSLSSARELSVEKKLKTLSSAREGPSIAGKLVIDLTSSKG